jgi:hypothetical protein
MPGRDMKVLREMSQKGWHISELKGFWYRFEEGEPHEYEYSLNLEQNPSVDMVSFYEASGWTPIVITEGYQIFRAEAGTPPIFSDWDSEREVLSENRRLAGKRSAILGGLLLLCLALLWFTAGNPAVLIVFLCVWCPFIFIFIPFIGYNVSLHKKRGR